MVPRLVPLCISHWHGAEKCACQCVSIGIEQLGKLIDRLPNRIQCGCSVNAVAPTKSGRFDENAFKIDCQRAVRL